MKITVHTLVKNEERFVWYAVRSIIDHVDKILLWDTGSTDKTPQILNEIKKRYPNKVDLKFLKSVTSEEFSDVRQKMLDQTKSDWILIVDGDEVWWEENIKKMVYFMKNNKLETIVNKTTNLIGDMYHYQPESQGKYEIDGVRGHLNIRAMNKSIPGLFAGGEHGVQGFYDVDNKLIQKRSNKFRAHCDFGYMHMTNLRRTLNKSYEKDVPKRYEKFKYGIGKVFPGDYYYPEAFFVDRPDIVESVWQTRKFNYLFGFVKKPMIFIKKRIFRKRTYGY